MMSPSSLAVFALKFLQKSMMFTPCGPSAVPTGGAGVALPAAIWSFTIACTFFAMAFFGTASRPFPASVGAGLQTRPPSNLLDLQEIQFHRCRPAEDRHHHLQGALV